MGSARRKARQGKERMGTGETGREEEQDAKSPHWVSESCSFVRYPALLFPLSSVSSRDVWRRRGAASRGQQGGCVCVENGGGILFLFLFFPRRLSCLGCTCLLLLLLASLLLHLVFFFFFFWSCSTEQGLLLAQLFSPACRRGRP